MNDIKLGDSHPLTEELKPLKVGGETSAIETAKKNARVTGDLEATGDIICDDITCDDITCDDIDCDMITSDLIRSSDDMTLDSGGDIILDSNDGNFIAKKAGTEFSVANSAFAGMILGYTTVGIDAADDSYTLSTGFVVTDSAHNVQFVAPPSGAVEIFVSVYGDLNRRQVYFGLSDNATYNTLDVTHEHSIALPGASNDMVLRDTWVIVGLTPGTGYKYWLGGKSSHAFSSTLRWGGDVTGEYAPFIMKATALPTAVTSYAVYG